MKNYAMNNFLVKTDGESKKDLGDLEVKYKATLKYWISLATNVRIKLILTF